MKLNNINQNCHSERSEESLFSIYGIIVAMLFLTTTTLLSQNTAPELTNVRFEQRTDGTHIVDIYYDLIDTEQSEVSVAIEVSNDAGTTWDFAATSLSGDIGENIAIGTNKHIVWNFANDHANYYSDQIQIKILADDGVSEGGGTPCPGTATVTYGGQTYNTVQIGNQCWFKENLNIGEYLASTSGGFLQTDNGTIEKYCFNNDENNCTKYGGLYEWTEAMQYVTTEGAQGICPTGWHIPSKAEFETLESYVNDEAAKLVDLSETINATAFTPTNETGFSALFAGYRNGYNGGNFGYLGSYTLFWGSTEYDSNTAYSLHLNISYSNVLLYNYYKYRGFGVRCLKD